MRRAVALCTLLTGYAVLSCQQISLRTSADDLGRHLRDGALLLAGRSEILHRNFYSYTHPDSAFLNHHWLTTVLFYLLSRAIGLAGLNAVYILLGACAFLLYFRIAEREAGLATASAIAALSLPLLSVRAGVRPEIFSTLMLAVFFTILWSVYRGRIRPAWLLALPALEAIWVNLHPGFVLGPVGIGAFLLASLLSSDRAHLRLLAAALGLSLLAGLANPNGLQGFLFPFTVSQNYGIEIRENLSVFHLNDAWLSNMIMAAAVFVFAGYFLLWRRRAKIDAALMLFSLALAAASLVFYRIYVFLGPFAFLSVCVILHALSQGKPRNAKIKPLTLRTPALAAIWIVAVVNAAIFMNGRWDTFGLDQSPADANLAAFLNDNSIRGRVFNEYSTGGYLIYYFPDQPVYVDSRPEAYPAAFLRDGYTRALEDESAWRAVLARYDFDYICMGRLGRDEGNFVLRRVQDPEWALVSGGTDVVLVRRNRPQFAALIARHEIHFR